MTFANAKEFITVWYAATNQAEVGERLQLDRRDVQNVAAYLRRNGVPLKDLPGRKAGINGQKMNQQEWEELCRHAGVCMSAEAAKRYRGGRS